MVEKQRMLRLPTQRHGLADGARRGAGRLQHGQHRTALQFDEQTRLRAAIDAFDDTSADEAAVAFFDAKMFGTPSSPARPRSLFDTPMKSATNALRGVS